MFTAQAIFKLAWWFIIAVSVFDAYLVLELRDLIHDTERNPVGRVLIQAANGTIWPFLLLKLAGTGIAGMTLLIIFQYNHRWGLAIAIALAVFQLGLLLHLQFG